MRAARAVRAVLPVAGLGLLVAAGCSQPDRVGEAEEGIAAVLADRLERPAEAITVTCPDDAELDDGVELTCEIATEGSPAVSVDFTIDDGGVVRLASAVIPTTAAQEYLAGELAVPAEGDVEVTCGDDPLLVKAVGETFDCEAVRAADGAAFLVTVEVVAVDGTVRYQVIPR